ncbi:T9SS type A sorting domain-containing protein [Pedobacter nanyangensis]|uniref:T9SS type A sorting domain-containing protein n=1 Tax=Pedobacter nanyangensis TaxID=1562389 RepID=UPI000DE25A30|nr:T9SS type A sorting domain-containing protein [Pedobacter nanyangensis]
MKHNYSLLKLKQKKILITLGFYCIIAMIIPNKVNAQTVISTNHLDNNGNGLVTFNIQNTNNVPVVIRSISCHLGTSANNNVSLLYHVNPVNDIAAPWDGGIVGAGQNGWISGGSAIVNSNSGNGVVQALDGLTITIPANTTYGFAFSASTLQYSTLTVGSVNTFSGGGVNLITGDGVSWGGVTAPATPGNYPRGFIGSITWYPISILKINLKDITAKNEGSKNKIQWSSLSESATDVYELERNIDGVNFTKIASFKANGKASSYSFIDENPSLGDNYYRLKLIEENDNAQYSQIVNANVKNFENFSITAYPNPVIETLHGSINGKIADNGTIALIDINQKTVQKSAISGTSFSINMKQLTSGVYLLKYSDKLNVYTQKIIKK